MTGCCMYIVYMVDLKLERKQRMLILSNTVRQLFYIGLWI